MPKDISKTRKILHTVRIYDDELLDYIEELNNTGYFSSKNAVINKSIELGIPLLYKELFGKKISVQGLIDNSQQKNEEVMRELKRINLNLDDVFVVLNILEYLTASLFNLEHLKLQGIPAAADDLYSGLLSGLPRNLEDVKKHILERKHKKKNN